MAMNMSCMFTHLSCEFQERKAQRNKPKPLLQLSHWLRIPLFLMSFKEYFFFFIPIGRDRSIETLHANSK